MNKKPQETPPVEMASTQPAEDPSLSIIPFSNKVVIGTAVLAVFLSLFKGWATFLLLPLQLAAGTIVSIVYVLLVKRQKNPEKAKNAAYFAIASSFFTLVFISSFPFSGDTPAGSTTGALETAILSLIAACILMIASLVKMAGARTVS